jgi:hypothetical protein
MAPPKAGKAQDRLHHERKSSDLGFLSTALMYRQVNGASYETVILEGAQNQVLSFSFKNATVRSQAS